MKIVLALALATFVVACSPSTYEICKTNNCSDTNVTPTMPETVGKP
jgi:hypothetical protein